MNYAGNLTFYNYCNFLCVFCDKMENRIQWKFVNLYLSLHSCLYYCTVTSNYSLQTSRRTYNIELEHDQYADCFYSQ